MSKKKKRQVKIISEAPKNEFNDKLQMEYEVAVEKYGDFEKLYWDGEKFVIVEMPA